MRKSLIIIFFTLLVACSMRLSISEIEKDLGPSLINDIAEYSNLSNSEIILNSFDLVYDEGNSYSGILNTTLDNGLTLIVYANLDLYKKYQKLDVVPTVIKMGDNYDRTP